MDRPYLLRTQRAALIVDDFLKIVGIRVERK